MVSVLKDFIATDPKDNGSLDSHMIERKIPYFHSKLVRNTNENDISRV